MPVAPVKSSQRPKLMIRRGRKVMEGVEVQAVFADIRSGQLKPKHEFSTDGVNWRRLDSHPQLAKVFASAPEPEGKKKGPLVFICLIILVAIVGAGLYFHPYLAFYNVQTAVDSRNVEKLSEWVDYPGFNQSVKGQLDAQWNEISTAQISPTPYATSANPAGRARVDKMIAALATPEAVMGFVRGETDRIGSWSRRAPKAPAVEGAEDPLADVGLNMESVTKVMDSVNGVLARGEFRYEGLSSFVATIKTVNGKNLDLVYEREGIGWKLTGVTLPAEPVRSSINDIAQSVLKDARVKARAASKKSKKGKKGKSDKKGKSVKQKPVQVAKLTSGKKAYMANIKLGRLSVGKGKKYLFGSPNPGLFATLANKGNRTLNEVEVTVYFYNGKGAIVSEKKLYPVSVSKYRPGRDNDPLKPQKAKKIGYLVKEFAPSSWAGKVQMRVTDIKFKE
jgi:hypothetical protein